MKKHSLLMATAAFALGVTMAMPAFAQGRSPNDGGSAAESAAGAKLSSAPAKSAPAPDYSKSANDGGPGPQPSAAQIKAVGTKTQAVNQPSSPAGRNPDDGGSIQ